MFVYRFDEIEGANGDDQGGADRYLRVVVHVAHRDLPYYAV